MDSEETSDIDERGRQIQQINELAPSPSADLPGPAGPAGPPAVVAVVVTRNPGVWFGETLEALAAQDYPNLAVLVIDAASQDDPLTLIAERLPNAYVRRLKTNPGFAEAANCSTQIVQGASHLILVHDDVAPAPNAVSAMMEVAIRENAGIVAPKLVDWHNETLLRDLGGTVDKSGSYLPAIEPGDLDQGQHDAGGEIFACRGGFVVVRADLFDALGGFDSAMTQYGEDIDLSWRAQLVGARIVTAPAARVRHLEACAQEIRDLSAFSQTEVPQAFAEDGDISVDLSVDGEMLRHRHRLRMVLKVHQGWRLPFVVMQLFVFSLAGIAFNIVAGRGRQVSAVVAAWTWNAVHVRDLWRLRRKVQHLRVVSDKQLMARFGSSRSRMSNELLTVWAERSTRVAQEVRGRELVGVLRRLPVAVWGTVLAIWLIGSRHVLTAPMPEIGEIVPFPDSPFDLLRTYAGIIPGDGFGATTPASPAHLIVGLFGLLFFGAMGVLHKLLVFGMFPLGVWGMARLTRQLKSPRARLFAVLAYAVVPLPYDSLAYGRWDGLIAYAVAPFLLNRVLRVHGSTPFMAKKGYLHLSFRRAKAVQNNDEFETLVVSDLSEANAAAMLLNRGASEMEITAVESPPDESRRDRVWFLLVRRVFPLALLLGLTGAFAPQLVPATVLIALCLLVGSLIAGEKDADRLRTLNVTLVSALLAIALLLPGILGSDNGWRLFWWHLQSARESTQLSTLLRFHTGGFVAQWASFGLLIAALPGILVGREWRFHLAARLWIVTLVFVGLTWMGERDWLGAFAPDPHVFLAIAAAAVGLNIAVSVLSLQDDLSTYRFGWRQLLPVVAFVGVIAAVLPIASRAGEGSWELPEVSQGDLLSWVDDEPVVGGFRVLWLGDADAMPGGARELSPDLAAAVSVDQAVPNGPALPAEGGIGQKRLAGVIERARDGDSVHLGRLLAPYGFRYIVMPKSTGAATVGGRPLPVPEGVVAMLAAQLDLRTVNSDSSLVVYENVEWAANRHMQSPDAIVASHNGDPYAALGVSMRGIPVLGRSLHGALFSGPVPSGELYVAETLSSAWQLTVNGKRISQREGFGWANTFAFHEAGNARLTYKPPLWISSAEIAAVLLWMLLFTTAMRHRARRGRFS